MTTIYRIRTLFIDFGRIINLLWQASHYLTVINALLQIVQAVLPVASLGVIKLLIEALIAGKAPFKDILYLLIGFGLIQFLIAVTGQYANYINSIQQQKTTDYLSGVILSKATTVAYSYYENPAYHDTLHLAQQQSIYKAPQILNSIYQVLFNGMSLCFLTAFFLTIDVRFALVFLLLSIPLTIIKWYYGFALLKLEKKLAPVEREAYYHYHILTGLNFVKEVRVFNLGHRFIAKFKQLREYIHNQKQGLHMRLTKFSLVAEAVEVTVMFGIFLALTRKVYLKAITIGAFVIYIQGFQRLQSSLKNFLQSMVQIFQYRLFLRDLFDFLNMPEPHSIPETNIGNVKNPIKGLIINNLCFTYPQTNRQVLHHINIKCAPGQIIAIVGENGSGKSTLAKLLARLYDAPADTIVMDGMPIDQWNMDNFRQQSAFLFQDFEKYFISIEDNIALGRSSEGQLSIIKDAAIKSGADEFIINLSNKYQTRLGRIFEGSTQLSGGQWQKLALARIFYRNARFIILDEPSSALDATAEYSLYQEIKQAAPGRITVLISHTLYNLKVADYIYVMQQGSITEQGTFDELLKKEDVFYKMFKMQQI